MVGNGWFLGMVESYTKILKFAKELGFPCCNYTCNPYEECHVGKNKRFITIPKLEEALDEFAVRGT